MNKKTICFIVVFMMLSLAALNAQMTKAQLQEMYVSYLRSEGYQPSVDSDGDVNFTSQGQRFYIDVMENDLQSFRLVLTNFIEIENASNRLKALETASQITNTTRVVRIFLTSSGKIAIDSFIFLAKPDDFKIHLSRLIGLMIGAKNEYNLKMGR